MVLRCKQIQWQKRQPISAKVLPTSYFDVLNKITEMDSQHIVGKGSLSSISPVNEHWQEVSYFDSEDSNKGYISAVSKDSEFRAIFDVNYINQVKCAVGFKGSFEKFLKEYEGVMYYTKPKERQTFYLNNERKNSSALLIIDNDKFYLISPRVDF